MLKLSALTREKKGEDIREEGLLPAVVYGAGEKSRSISLPQSEFVKIFRQAGEATLIDLEIDGKNAGKVLIHDFQNDPVNGRITHADLLLIDMNKVITASVEIRFVGEAPAVKGLGGTMVHNVDAVEVECLPKDLVSHLDVDLSALKTFDDVIRVSDLPLPAGLKVVEPTADTIIVKAVPSLTEEQFKAMEAEAEAAKATDLSKIESAAPKKEEAEEGEAAEGEAGAAKVAPAGEKKEEKKEAKK